MRRLPPGTIGDERIQLVPCPSPYDVAVAAELRRIADLDPSWTICGPATFLLARADELDPPATRED